MSQSIAHQIGTYMQTITQRQSVYLTVFDVVGENPEYQVPGSDNRHRLEENREQEVESSAVHSENNDKPVMVGSIAQLLQRAQEYQIAGHGSMIAAVLYIHRFLRMSQSPLTLANSVPLFTAALCVANKYLEDVPYNNLTFSRLSGIPTRLLTHLELHFLAAIRFRMAISQENFETLHALFVAPTASATVVPSASLPVIPSSTPLPGPSNPPVLLASSSASLLASSSSSASSLSRSSSRNSSSRSRTPSSRRSRIPPSSLSSAYDLSEL